jgi:hypothetical protein
VGLGSSPPKPAKLPAPPPAPHDLAPEVLTAREDMRRAAMASAGRGSTILSRNALAGSYPVGTKSLLGGAT